MNIPVRLYPINNVFAGDDWASISVFKKKAKEFIETREKTGPKIICISAKRLDCGGFEGKTNIPRNKDLKLFYHDFRFFYNERDLTFFLKFRNLISRAIIGKREKSYLRSLKHQWQMAMSRKHFSDFIQKKISGKKLLKLWFNAEYFHPDLDKRKELTILNNLLSEDLTRSFLYQTVIMAGAPVGLLYKAIEPLEPDNLFISVPDDFIRYND